MQCPVCGSFDQRHLAMKVGQFDEVLSECQVCGSQWSLNHGLPEVVFDSQQSSFLSCLSDLVEADDYNWAA